MNLLINRPELVGNPAYSGIDSIVERESPKCIAFICRDQSGATLTANVTSDGLNLFVQRDEKVESVIHVQGDMLLDFLSWALRSHLKVSLYDRQSELNRDWADAVEKQLGVKL